jgi:hypothetical protein
VNDDHYSNNYGVTDSPEYIYGVSTSSLYSTALTHTVLFLYGYAYSVHCIQKGRKYSISL